MLDFSEQIKLDPAGRRRYTIAHWGLYLVFLLAAVYLSWLVLFPSRHFVFFFRTPLASKNTILEPRDGQGKLLRSGRLESPALIFDTALSSADGNFSKIKVSLLLDKGSAPIENAAVLAQKSYRSFLYPEGEPVPADEAPKNGREFASGRLLSNGQSVCIIDENSARAIDSEITFESLGFNWDDVAPASSEQLEEYEEGKLFTIAGPHPSGTIFAARESGAYYLVDGGTRRKFTDSADARKFLRGSPILVSEKSLEIRDGCSLKKDFSFFGRSYSCEFAIENMHDLIGNNYQYRLELIGSGIKLKEARVAFEKSVNRENWKLALHNIRKNITLNYYGEL